jgi:hypothetical protein
MVGAVYCFSFVSGPFRQGLIRVLLLFWLTIAAMPAMAADDSVSSMATLQSVARVVQSWDGQDPGALFRAVRAANPSKGAIVSMRELNKAVSEGILPMNDLDKVLLSARFKIAQRKVKEKIISVRKDAHQIYAVANPKEARTLSADGDVGSWRTSDDINSDVDWTSFGTDRNATKDFVENYYNKLLLRELVGDDTGMDLKQDFDIVVTPEGWEKDAGVFETSGGKSLAKTVMTVVTPVNADGTLGTPKRNDVAAELENTKTQAKLRELATRMDVYDLVFNDKGGFLRHGDFKQPPQDPARQEAWERFMDAADEEGLLFFDGKIVKRETLAGTCLDMAKHLHHEAIEQLGTLDKKGQVKRIMKYPGRSEWAYGKSSVSPALIEAYVVMGDARIRELLQQSRAFHQAKESKSPNAKQDFARIIDDMAAKYSDSRELGHLALEMIVRQSHLAMQLQLDRIVRIDSPTERAKQLQALMDDFAVMESDGALGAFARGQKTALSQFKSVSDDPETFKKLKESYTSLDKIDAATGDRMSRARDFLSQSELGQKILTANDQVAEIVDKLKRKKEAIEEQIGDFQIRIAGAYEQLKQGSELLRFVELLNERVGEFKEIVNTPTKDFQAALDKVGTLVDVLDAVGKSRTDADLAYNLGKLFWDNTAVGGMVNTLYAFVYLGDNEALAKFVMFALCPQASIPELVNKIGSFTMRTGAARLFDMQLDTLYRASSFSGDPEHADKPRWKGKEPWLLANFADYGPGVPAVAAFLDDLLQPGGYAAALDMISKLKGRPSDNQLGNEALAKTAVAKAVWMTLALGDHLVLKDDAALGEATQRIKLLTDEIVFLAKRLGKEVARSPENFNMPDGASPGEQAAINKLVKERDDWVAKGKLAMAEAITRTFQERRRAEADLSDEATKRRLDELRAILTKLDILDPGLYNLGEEGSYNFLLRNVPFVISSKQQQRKLVEAINRYFDTYSQILSLREAISQLAMVHAGKPLDKLPLTGAPPLCGERSIDLQNALSYFEKVREGITETQQSLAGIKGAPLAGPFDDRIRRGVTEAVMAMAQEEATGAIARACRELHWKVEVLDRNKFTEAAAESTTRFEAARIRRDELIEEFRKFYATIRALAVRIQIAPSTPIQKQPMTAQAAVNGAVPEGASWVWDLIDQGSRVRTMQGASIRFDAPFRGRYTLKASLVLSGVVVRTASADFTVTGGSGLRVALAPVAPEPRGTIVAEAVWSTAPGGGSVTYEWNCSACVLVEQRGARATFRAPDSGGGAISVRASLAGARLGEASAAFMVDDPKKPTKQTTPDPKDPRSPPPVQPTVPPIGALTVPQVQGSSPGAKPQQAVPVTSASPGANMPAATASTVPDLPLGTWKEAIAARDRYLDLWRRNDLGPAEHALANKRLEEAQARMNALLDEASADVKGLSAYIGRYIAELERIYGGFKARGPKAPDRPYEGGNVTDLDGETPWSRYQCVINIDKEKDERVRQAKALQLKAGTVESMLSRIDRAFNSSSRAATEAMEAFEAFWPSQTLFSRKWRSAGLQLSIHDPCSDTNASATLKLDPLGPAATQPVATSSQPAALPPKVSLTIDPASKGKADLVVIARAEGGTAPLRYRWTGARSDTGERAIYAAPIGRVLGAQASVQVTDSAGKTASASIPLDALPLSLELTRTQPASGDVAVGGQVTLAVRLSSPGVAVDPSAFVFRWEPSTEAHFSRPEGSNVTTNVAAWPRPGKAKVWVVALRREGAALVTAGESNQIDLNIVGAGIALRAEPASPLVGQEVKITAVETPTAADGDAAYWWEHAGQALGAGQTQSPRVFSYIAKDTQPVTVTAHLKERRRGEEIARQALTISARPYSVSVVNLGAAFDNATTRPVVWRPGQGLVTLGKEIAAHQDVALRADISPAPATTQLRYRWSVGEGVSLSGNPAARETRVQRATRGSIQATVEVRDANDILLGRASASASVTVSDEDLATGKQKAAELAKLKEEAGRAWSEGELDAACQKGNAAKQIDPKLQLAATYCTGRDRIQALVREVEGFMKPGASKSDLDNAQAKLDQASAINQKAKPLADLRRRLETLRGGATDTAKALAEAASVWSAGDAGAAVKIAAEAAKAAPTNVEAQVQKKRYEESLAALEASVRTARDAVARKDVEAAARAVAGGMKVMANYRPLLELNQTVASLRQADQQARAERQRHLDLLQAGTQACDRKNWKDCKEKLEAGLANGSRVFQPVDGPATDKARMLLAKATAELTAAQQPPPNGKQQTAASLNPGKQQEADRAAAEQKCRAVATQGIQRQTAKDHAGAIPLYKEALALCPNLCPVMNNLGVAYESTGNRAAAKTWFEAALKCAPDNALFRKNAANYQTQAPPQPVSTPTAGGYDGVYQGWADRDGKRIYRYVATVTGSRIVLVAESDEKKQQRIGVMQPNGEFEIRHLKMVYKGRIVGKRVTGTWTLRFSLFGNKESIYTGGFTGEKIR